MHKICALGVVILMILPALAGADILTLKTRIRSSSQDDAQATIKSDILEWESSQTAIVICDMWDQHWCKGATERVAEMAPYLNRFVSTARDKGVLIVHAPSSVVEYYNDHPARDNVVNTPKAKNVPAKMGDWCDQIDSENKDLWPIDQSDGGCDDQPVCEQGNPWRKQIETIEIANVDFISDDGVEIWNVFENRGINNVILVGVHTNMCVIGRPFGLRNMKRIGKNVLLCRDLTDTMYNSRMKPYVTHFEGTDLMIDYIEKYICPTIVSTDLTNEPVFQFKENTRKH